MVESHRCGSRRGKCIGTRRSVSGPLQHVGQQVVVQFLMDLKPDRLLSQLVDIWRLSDRIAVAGELSSQVVGSDQQNIEVV